MLICTEIRSNRVIYLHSVLTHLHQELLVCSQLFVVVPAVHVSVQMVGHFSVQLNTLSGHDSYINPNCATHRATHHFRLFGFAGTKGFSIDGHGTLARRIPRTSRLIRRHRVRVLTRAPHQPGRNQEWLLLITRSAVRACPGEPNTTRAGVLDAGLFCARSPANRTGKLGATSGDIQPEAAPPGDTYIYGGTGAAGSVDLS